MNRPLDWLACLVLGLMLHDPALGGTTKPDAVSTSTASTSPTQPQTDIEGQDPVELPRPGGLVRTSSSFGDNTRVRTETATYASRNSADSLISAYKEQMKASGWQLISHSDTGNALQRVVIIDWDKPPRQTEVRFYTEKEGASRLWVRQFTFLSGPQATQPKSGIGAAKTSEPPKAPNSGVAKSESARTADVSKQTGAAALGPPPTNFKVNSFNPAMHQLSWSGTNVSSYDLYRVDSKNGRAKVLDKANTLNLIDYAFLLPNTTYSLVARYADGSMGTLDYNYASPPQPKTVANLKAVQSAPNTIKVTWDSPDQYSYSYQVFGPTLPAEGLKTSANQLELKNVRLGNHEVRVAILYGSSEKLLKAPVEAKVPVTVVTDRGRYRITCLGLNCVHETSDDPLQLDGKRDEVYLGVYVASVSPTDSNKSPVPLATLRTKVMGDTNGFSDRIQAGTASDKGGIQTGDYVPDSTITTPKPGVTGATDRFPLAVWEGELRDSSDLLVVAPTVFEWDSNDPWAWNEWTSWWATPNGSRGVRDGAVRSVTDKAYANFIGTTLANTYETEAVVSSDKDLDGTRWKIYYAPEYTNKTNRPVGLMNQSYTDTHGTPTQPTLYWIPTGMVLNRAKLEGALGTQDAVIVPWTCADSIDVLNSELVGSYTVYFQIERLKTPDTPAPAAAPAGHTTKAPAPSNSRTDTIGTLPPNRLNTDKARNLSTQTGAAPAGPAPTMVRVDSNGPAIHKIGWSVTWSQTLTWRSFDIYRIDSKGRTAVVPNLPGDPNKSRYEVTDRGYLEAGTKYLIQVNYSDGSIGSAEYTYATPPNPPAPTGFRAAQSGDGEVTLNWVRTDYVAGYQIYGSTLPPEGKYLDGSATYTTKVSGLGLGHCDFQIALVYTGEGKLYPAPNRATTGADLHRVTDRYRVVCLGLECRHETSDDPLQLDGKRDEVFMGAYLATVPRQNVNNPVPTPRGTVRTKVMGDTGGFPDRIQAGTASDKGGIQTGDFVPSAAATAVQPGVTGTTDRFPLLLWEGELSDNGDLVVISPILFEWDKADEGGWNEWLSWWSTPRGQKDVGNLAHTQYVDKRWDTVLSSTWDVATSKYDSYQRNYGPGFPESGGNRPIGVEDQANMQSTMNVPTLVYVPKGIVLDHLRIEEKLGSSNTVLINWQCKDEPHAGPAHLDGDYTLYIQIERLTPPAAKRPGKTR